MIEKDKIEGSKEEKNNELCKYIKYKGWFY